MLAVARSGATLGRVALHSADPDRLRVRQRFERALTTVDWTPPGIGSHAILVVRRLSTSRGGRASVARHVTGELRRLAGRARRPWLDHDASSADAVMFADEAELVACLIRDQLQNLVADRWWWSGILAGVGADHWLRERVWPRGDVLVPALSLLLPRVDAVAWVSRLPQSDAAVAAACVARALAMPISRSSAHVVPSTGQRRGDDAGRTEPGRAGSPTAGESHAVARLIAMVPELRARTLDVPHRVLLAVVCAATRTPSWTRTAQFAHAIAALERVDVEQVASGSDRCAIPEGPWPVDAPRRSADAQRPSAAATTIDVPVVSECSSDSMVDSERQASSSTRPLEVTIHRDEHEPGAPIDTPVMAGGAINHPLDGTNRDVSLSNRIDGTAFPLSQRRRLLENPSAPPPSGAPRHEDTSPFLATRATETAFGGIFYVLNAWLAMGLYGDFTAPRASNFVLSPWDLLALVGRAWFGDAFVADPVWNVLAHLAVRDPDEDPDRDSQLADGWLREHVEALTARIQGALADRDARDIARLVCCHRAAIETTPSAVHVHLLLSELPLDLRVAGLDRDPGWIPAAGRSLFFHFA